jgi:5-methylcytosine-specific restriction endonuclease McrBC GTP-binding regulatory subunit McrB
MKPPIQKILFGSPGTGKSYKIRSIAQEQLGINLNQDNQILQNTVKTVFHPEYTYADFMGKLLPLTQGGSVIYKYYPGHFLRVLGMAYKSLIEEKDDHFLLVIDELNRGNASAIFGTVFQLLDREDDFWSSYEIDISEMELIGLLESMGHKAIYDGNIKVDVNGSSIKFGQFCDETLKVNRVTDLLREQKIKLPNNLSIIATINTSDESIYYLDSAFKRRWDWEYIDSPNKDSTFLNIPRIIVDTKLLKSGEEIFSGKNDRLIWWICIVGLNEFIKSNHQAIRRIEDKQIGWWFIKPRNNVISLQEVKDKLMFYLWDSVFSRDKRPLEEALKKEIGKEVKLITYADFIQNTEYLLSFAQSYAEDRGVHEVNAVF